MPVKLGTSRIGIMRYGTRDVLQLCYGGLCAPLSLRPIDGWAGLSDCGTLLDFDMMVGNATTNYGYDKGLAIGSLVPDITSHGSFIFAVIALDSGGNDTVYLSLGNAGDELELEIFSFDLNFQDFAGNPVKFKWNDVNSRYETANAEVELVAYFKQLNGQGLSFDIFNESNAFETIDPPSGFAGTGSFPPATNTLTWVAPTGNSFGVSYYDIYRDDLLLVTGVTGTSYADDDAVLAADTSYKYQIKAIDKLNHVSDFASHINVAVPNLILLSGPTGLVADQSVDYQSIDIVWDTLLKGGASFPVASYNVYRDGLLIGNTSGLTMNDTPPLTPNAVYTYDVAGIDTDGNEGAISTITEEITVFEANPINVDVEGVPEGWYGFTIDDSMMTGLKLGSTNSIHITGLGTLDGLFCGNGGQIRCRFAEGKVAGETLNLNLNGVSGSLVWHDVNLDYDDFTGVLSAELRNSAGSVIPVLFS